MPFPVWSSGIERVAAGVRRVARRHGDLPVELIVLSRLIVGLGRDLTANSDELLRPRGLSESDFRVLVQLYGQPDGSANAGELVSSAAHSPANITRIADTLVGRGLITRVPGVADRRRVLLRITRRGESLVRALLPKLCASTRQAFGVLSRTEARRLRNDLCRIAGALTDMAAAARTTEDGA
jgi:MarR family transcriptional repressor of emrRAB